MEETPYVCFSQLSDAAGLPDRWAERPIKIRKFIDDTSGQEKIALRTGVRHITEEKEEVHVHAWKSEEMFNRISANAAAIGMEVNPAKTQLLCITSAINYEVRSFVYINGEKHLSEDCLKLLGYSMGRRPNADAHIKEIRRKYGARAWILRHLQQVGIQQGQLVQIYCSLVRPIFEYPAVVFHSGLQEDLSAALERMQSASLRSIFGQAVSYSLCLEKAGIPTLKNRRDTLLRDFALRAADSTRFGGSWFPKNERPQYELRKTRKYKQEHATRDRLLHAPIFRMRQLLNELDT